MIDLPGHCVSQRQRPSTAGATRHLTHCRRNDVLGFRAIWPYHSVTTALNSRDDHYERQTGIFNCSDARPYGQYCQHQQGTEQHLLATGADAGIQRADCYVRCCHQPAAIAGLGFDDRRPLIGLLLLFGAWSELFNVGCGPICFGCESARAESTAQ